MERDSCFFVVVLVGRHWKLSAIVLVMLAVMMHDRGKGYSSGDQSPPHAASCKGCTQGMCSGSVRDDTTDSGKATPKIQPARRTR